MKLLKKVIAGFLLAFGIPFSIVAVIEIVNPQTAPKDRQDAVAALTILTLPSTVAGGWLARGLYKQGQKEISNRLHSTFYQLLKQGKGQISALNFAMETHLSAEAAKQYLDVKAKEFNATFTLSEDGGVFYNFNEFSALPLPESIDSPSVPHSTNYWTIGSTKDDVLRVQGTPTKITRNEYSDGVKEEFYYGSWTKVIFKNGRVVEYDNYDNTLKVFVERSSPE